MSGEVDVGVVILPDQRWRDVGIRWRQAEELGFAHAWTYDHLSWRSLRDGPWFGPVTTLTAAATVTERIRLGTLVASPNFRHPVPFAKDVLGLDDVSDGRIILGLGAGGVGWDATVLGQEPWSPTERSERFGEFVTLLDRLLREPEVTHEGVYYSAHEARQIPGCVQEPRVPFAVAGIGPRSMALAARLGEWWVTTGDRTGAERSSEEDVDVVARQMARIDDACAAVDRDPGSLRRMVLTGAELAAGLESADRFDDTLGRYGELGVTDLVVHWPREEEPYAGDESAFLKIFSR